MKEDKKKSKTFKKRKKVLGFFVSRKLEKCCKMSKLAMKSGEKGIEKTNKT